MNITVSQYIRNLNRRNFTNNVQRVLYTLLTAPGWVSRGSFRVPSATARLRDLRKSDYGNFSVECKNSSDLGRTGTPTTWYALTNTHRLTVNQLRRVFEGV